MGTSPMLMAIVNVTPDSFSDGGQFLSLKASLDHIYQCAAQGATIIDIGGASSRPGSVAISAQSEWERIGPLLQALYQEKFPLPVSIDTMHAIVAQQALELGATMINDISALSDPTMASTVARYQAKLVLMHMQGSPATMQDNPTYTNITQTILQFWQQRAQLAMQAGIDQQQIWVDPGIGFGKTTRHNMQLLQALPILCQQPYPVLLGPSRKRFLGEMTGKPVEQRDEATAAVCAIAAAAGVAGLRIHNVAACRDAAQIGWSLTTTRQWRARLDSNQLPPDRKSVV